MQVINELFVGFVLSGYPVPYVFLKDNAQTHGYSAEASSYLIVYMCAVNTVGRVAAGKFFCFNLNVIKIS